MAGRLSTDQNYVVCQEGAAVEDARGWNTATVDEIAEKVGMGPFGSSIKVETFVPKGVPVISGQHLHGFRVDDTPGFNFISYEHAQRLANANVVRGDIVMTHRGTIGQVALIPENSHFDRYVVSQSQFYLRCDRSKIVPEFLAMYFRSPEGQHQLLANASQVGVPSIAQPVTYLRTVEIPLPPLPEQRAIAHVLGTLDDKIELNLRMSATLEAMARAVFKDWFVDFGPVRAKLEGREPYLPPEVWSLFPDRLVDSELGEIPEGWEVGTLGNYFELAVGGVWGKDTPDRKAQESLYCLRGIDCHVLAEGRIPEAPVRWVTPHQLEKRRIPTGAILIEASGSFCGRSLLWRDAYSDLFDRAVIYSNFVKRLNPICSSSQAAVCWQFVRKAFQDGEIQTYRTGTAFPNLDVKALLANLEVIVPPHSLSNIYAQVDGRGSSIEHMKESRTLAAQRNILLPKLISGEVRPVAQ